MRSRLQRIQPPRYKHAAFPRAPRSPVEFMRKHLRIDKFDVVLAAAILLGFLVIANLPFAPPKFGDEYFHQEAQWLAWFAKGAGPWKDVVITRAPGPDLYYALVYLLVPAKSSGNTYWVAAVLWNALWVIVATMLLRRTGEALAGPSAGRWAAVLSLTAPFIIYYSCGVAAETPTYLGCVVFAYGWAKRRTALESSHYAWVALGGLVLFVLSRPNIALVSALMVAAAALLWRKRTAVSRQEAKFALLCAFTAVASLLAVSEALKLLPKKLGTSQQEKNFSDVMFFGSFQCRTELLDWRFWGKKTKAGSVDYESWSAEHDRLIEESKSGEASLATLELNWAFQDILHHPLLRLRMTLVRIFMLNVAIMNSDRVEQFGSMPFERKLLFVTAHVVLNAIASLPLAGALVFLFRPRNQVLSHWALWTPWLTLLLFHAFVYAEPRYMLSSRPLLSLMAASEVANWPRRRRGAVDYVVHLPEERFLPGETLPQKERKTLGVTRPRAAQG